jgi:hypothetical protein
MRLLDVDPWTGVREYGDYDASTDSLTIHRVQDVEAILDRNKALQTAGHWKNNAALDEEKMDMRLAACIPNIVQERWLREHGVNIWEKDHWPAVKRLLNSSDWKWLKAADVKI